MHQSNKLTFHSGVSTVTGANFLLDTGSMKILIDCGMIQGEDFSDEANQEVFPYDPSSIDFLLITHAHLDHVGRIPKLVKEGFKGIIYSTPETKELAELVLNDAANILATEAVKKDQPLIYDTEDVARAFTLWRTVEYHNELKLNDNVSIFLKDAGHILGSAMIEIRINDPKILFTGDLGNSPSPLLKDTENVGEVDYIVMESTYGDSNHELREESDKKLEKIIRETIERNGSLVIPAFSIDRTQVLLYELNNLVERGKIPSVPIFLDSPMATKATEIYRSSQGLFNDRVKAQIANGDDIFSFPRLKFTVSQWESKGIIKESNPKIILAGSGMSMGGRVIGHERNYLPDANSTILLVGYQSTGSLGRELVEGNKKVHIHGETVHVRAHIEAIYGYSAHKDSDHLLEFVCTATEKLRRVFVVMGEPKASMYLAQRINNEIGKNAIVPEVGEQYDL